MLRNAEKFLVSGQKKTDCSTIDEYRWEQYYSQKKLDFNTLVCCSTTIHEHVSNVSSRVKSRSTHVWVSGNGWWHRTIDTTSTMQAWGPAPSMQMPNRMCKFQKFAFAYKMTLAAWSSVAVVKVLNAETPIMTFQNKNIVVELYNIASIQSREHLVLCKYVHISAIICA